MKKFLITIVCFALTCVGVDALVGLSVRRLEDSLTSFHADNKTLYALNHMTNDVVVLGASTAFHHYSPSLLSFCINAENWGGWGKTNCI